MPPEPISCHPGSSSLLRWGALAAFAMPLCYVGMFVIFGVFLDVPQTEVVDDRIAYVARHQWLVAMAYVVGYFIFGGFLLIAVQAIHQRLAVRVSALLNSASIFGLMWVAFMMASGMLAIVGLHTMVTLHQKGSVDATTLFFLYTTTVNALGGGIELLGGLWMLLLSAAAWHQRQLSMAFNAIGLSVGVLGVLTIYQGVPALKAGFGLGQVVWFVWLGFLLLGSAKDAPTVTAS